MAFKQIVFTLRRSHPVKHVHPTMSLLSPINILSVSDLVIKHPNAHRCVHTLRISSVKVKWRKDSRMDEAIQNDKKWRLCMKVVREVLKEPGQVISLRYLENRRERLRLPVKVETFLKQQPGLFEIYMDRIKPKTQPVKFLRISHRLAQFLKEEKIIYEENESLLVDRLMRILMMTSEKKISVDKLVEAKRDFGFPDDFISSLVPKYPNLFGVIPPTKNPNPYFLALVSPELIPIPLSAIERRAREESLKTRWPRSPAFIVSLPRGLRLKKAMLEWTRNWMERPYISPYVPCTDFHPNSPEMEKRTVGVVHEFLSLTVFRRMAVPVLGKFGDDLTLPNAFLKIFTRHPGIFYLSRKGGIETAMLREAYYRAKLIEKDPLVLIKDRFCELLREGLEDHTKQARALAPPQEEIGNKDAQHTHDRDTEAADEYNYDNNTPN